MRTQMNRKALLVFSVFCSFSLLTGPLPSAMAANSCDSLCGVTAANAKNLINDANCKKSDTCVNCVVKAVTGSQSGAYCSAYSDSNKGQGLQKVTATLNLASAAVCATACVMGMTPAGTPVAWDRVCGFAGLANTALEVGMAIKDIAKGDGNILSLGGSIISGAGSISMIRKVTTGVTKTMMQKAMSPSCINAVLFGINGAAKIKSIKDLKKSGQSACDSAQSLTSMVEGNVQSCLAALPTPPIKGSSSAGMFAATASAFTPPTPDAVDHLAATIGTDKYLKNVKSDLTLATDAGKLDMNEIGKKVDSGESAANILSAAGMPENMTDMVKEAEGRINRGETSPLLASITGDSYKSGSGSATVAGGSGIDEMGFGGSGGATPGESNSVLEIFRAPASTASLAASQDGDVFHASYNGTIFDIVSGRIKERKSQYSELEPEGRVNRIFNGYSDPKAKK